MWRSERNAFVRTTPAHLDTQYSVAGRSASLLTDDIAVSNGRWFHVPGSCRSAAPPLPDGLVSSGLQTSALPVLQRTSYQDVRSWEHPSTESVDTGERYEYVSSDSISCRGRSTEARFAAAAPTGEEVSRLLRQYRDENTRLREQLRIKALHETHLTSKLEELSRRHALLQLECQRTARDPIVTHVFAEDAESTTTSTTGGGVAPATSLWKAHSQLAQKEDEVRQLQVTVRELEGRVTAYREALQRARVYRRTRRSHSDPTSTEDNPPTQQHVEASDTRPHRHHGDDDHDNDSTANREPNSRRGGAPASLHVLLLESLNTADFLVKVFNAIQHCQSTPHRDGDGCGVANPLNSTTTLCPRSREECTLRCLQAAMKGATLPPDLLELADGPENNTSAANVEAALAVREELMYCETVAVRLAAGLLGRRSGGAMSVTAECSTADDADTAGNVAVVDSAGATTSASPQRSAATPSHSLKAKEASSVSRVGNDEAALPSIRGTPAKAPCAKASRCRPDMDDCEVQ
jgi:hypothetical protein